MKAINMTRKEFDALPLRKWNENIGVFRSLVILPGRIKDMHDSGYRCMDFAAVDKNGEAICRLAGGSDVIHIEGIGGYGNDWVKKFDGVPDKIKPMAWSIDCLPKSGLLNLFPRGGMTCGAGLSSFEVYSVDEK